MARLPSEPCGVIVDRVVCSTSTRIGQPAARLAPRRNRATKPSAPQPMRDLFRYDMLVAADVENARRKTDVDALLFNRAGELTDERAH